MIIIDPVDMSDAVLVSSNVPEMPVAEYAAGTTYAAGALAGVTSGTAQLVYRSLQAGNSGHAPAASSAWWAAVAKVYAPYASGTTYAVDAVVSQVGANVHDLYKSLVGGNVGNPLSDKTRWQRLGVTNRLKMFDNINSSATENAEAIVVTVNPGGVIGGYMLAGLEADTVVVTMTDPVNGVVSTQTHDMLQSNSGSSFWNWFFKKIVRKTLAVSVQLPAYAGATLTISINKPGGIARCGTCKFGSLTQVGFSEYGLSTDIKDFSTTRFNVDGTTETVERGYVKRMTVDTVLDNDVIDSVQQTLAGFRQRPVVYVGASMFESAVIFGKYSSFKNVISGFNESRMSLQIEGMV